MQTIQKPQALSLSDIEGVRIGHAGDDKAKTGVTVLYFPKGAYCGVDISGGGPASRETPLAIPGTADNRLNALVFAGGSTFGLAASDGVLRCLEEHGIGYDTGFARVPLVCQSDIYDLGYGSASVRPGAAMGYAACAAALSASSTAQGNVGCGTGATVGKAYGISRAQKGGWGIQALRLGPLTLVAVVCVNAFGDIFRASDGKKIAGLLTADRRDSADSVEALYQAFAPHNLFTGDENSPAGSATGDTGAPINTTIGAVITNAAFSKAELCKIASMTRSAYSRCIRPVGTMADGDTIYAASTGSVTADINVVGVLAAQAMATAIENAVTQARISEEEFLANISYSSSGPSS